MKKRIKIIILFFAFIISIISWLCFHKEKSEYGIYSTIVDNDFGFLNLAGVKREIQLYDSTVSLNKMKSYSHIALSETNCDSLFYKLSIVYPNLQKETFISFYKKNSQMSAIKTSLFHCLSRLNKKIADKNGSLVKINFSNVGFNKKGTQAMVYVESRSLNAIETKIIFYYYKFGLWLKAKEFCLLSLMTQQDMHVPTPPR